MTNTQGMLLAGNAGAAIRAAAAVAITPAGLVECSSSTSGGSFVGFAVTAVGVGDPLYVVGVRGSVVGPLIEGGGVLTIGTPVFLSATLGEVTQTPSTPGAGVFNVQVGIAQSASTILLNTDFKVGRPS
jgi:hypothetical protein